MVERIRDFLQPPNRVVTYQGAETKRNFASVSTRSAGSTTVTAYVTGWDMHRRDAYVQFISVAVCTAA